MTEQRVGDPLRFALEFALTDDPDAGGEASVRASWGRLRVWVGGRNLTIGRSPSGVSLDAAEVPLLPVVEWIAEHWDALLHEERLPMPSAARSAAAWRAEAVEQLPADDAALFELMRSREAFWQRHALGAALPGFRVPDLHIRRNGWQVELSWGQEEWDSLPSGVTLVQRPGQLLLPPSEVADVLFAFSEAVLGATIAQLADPADRARPAQAKARLRACETEDRHALRLRWMAGSDRVDEAARRLRALAGVTLGSIQQTVEAFLGLAVRQPPARLTTPTLPALLFSSASPALTPADLTTLLELTQGNGGAGPGASLRSLQVSESPPSGWQAITEDGLEKAMGVREALGIPPAAPIKDLETEVLARLGVVVRDIQLDDAGVEGAAVTAEGLTPTVVINRSSRRARTAWGRRMTLAHELCHVLYDIGPEGQLAQTSGPWADSARERRANAFAVTLLAPAKALRSLLPASPRDWSVGDLQDAMKALGIGLTTLTWQLQNLGWIGDAERQAWVDEFVGWRA